QPPPAPSSSPEEEFKRRRELGAAAHEPNGDWEHQDSEVAESDDARPPAVAALSADRAEIPAARLENETASGIDGLIVPGNLQDFEVGEFVEALQAKAGQVTVVKLLVVDRQAGLQTLQVLLARNEVNFDQPAVPEEAFYGSAGPEDDQLIAVYVEAT